MPTSRFLSCTALLLTGLASAQVPGNQKPPTAPPTLSVTSRLAFLDVTVLDKKNHPVTSGLTRDDFTITQDHQPQRIFSFEGPDAHVTAAVAIEDGPAGTAPLTEIVLDRLNSTFPDFAYNRIAARKYIASQPELLDSPTELMLLDNTSFELLQSYTRSRADLLDAIDHIPVALPWKLNGSFFPERFLQSIDALREIALQTEGIPGRKNVLWIGSGIGINTDMLAGDFAKLKWYAHDTTNALVDARISLFVIYPGISGAGIAFSELYLNPQHPYQSLNQNDPFAGNISFGAFANETGGAVLRNNNFPEVSMREAQTYGSNYYTLTYRPPEGASDGQFRRVVVTMRDPRLHAVTKVGYYAPDDKAPFNPQQQEMLHIGSEVRSAIPFDALRVTLESIVRHSDSSTVELTLLLSSKNLAWQPGDPGTSNVDVTLAAVSLSHRRDILASKTEGLTLSVPIQDRARLSAVENRIHVTLRTPRKTQSVRVVLEATENGRAGSVEIPRAALDAALDAPTPEPKLIPQPLKPRSPAPSSQPTP